MRWRPLLRRRRARCQERAGPPVAADGWTIPSLNPRPGPFTSQGAGNTGTRFSGPFRGRCVSRPSARTNQWRAPMIALLNLIDTLITLYIWVIIIGVVLSWLIAFNVINTHNRFVYLVVDTINRLTEPVLRPIRNLLPNLGGLDISPVILLLLLFFIQNLIRYDIPMWLGAGRY
ncbi:MAG TPA: YggT family protein [Rhodobiaceae bacterium]|nr:YggT family protein [Rhodobiaceae bacterium]